MKQDYGEYVISIPDGTIKSVLGEEVRLVDV